MNRPRHRPLAVGPLRAFEAVARRLSFRAAGEELFLTQPAISRQIRSLEEELGAPLFLRGTRHVELTGPGAALLREVAPLLDRLDASVRQIRHAQGRRQIGVTTFASFASLWLLPRLQEFQRAHPGIDIRISAADGIADFDDPELDLGLRYCLPADAPPGSEPLFGELLTPVASPSLRPMPLLPSDLAQHTLLEEDDDRPSTEFISWRRWLALQAPAGLQPRDWIYLNYTHQQVQAALAGQGIALARCALVGESLQRGELVEPFGAARRITSPYGYWLVRWPHRRERPELQAFEDWLLAQAAATRGLLGSLTAPAA
jgi:LysR family transcriptional regulator, glycine cleavage system transcriptional activator